MPYHLELDPDFNAPALRAGLDVLLIFARILRTTFSDPDKSNRLDQSNLSCMKLAQVLGSLLADSGFSISNKSEIGDIWQAFFVRNEIKNLRDDQRAILEGIRDESIILMNTSTDCLEDFQEANVQAHKLVRDILVKHGLERLIGSSPVPIELKNDPSGTGYCAGASPLTGKIVWSYQQVSHALIGLILVDLIFSHEYLSHLVPQNPYLGHAIREQWLVSALVESLREESSYPRWKIRLWPAYQRMLRDHIARSSPSSTANVVRTFGYEGILEMSMILHSIDADLFWRLTVEILEHQSDTEHAKLADGLAFKLIGHNFRSLIRHNIKSLNDLQSYL